MSTYCPQKQDCKETGTSVTEPTSCWKEICRVCTIWSHWFPQPNPPRSPGSSCGLPFSDSRQQPPVVQTQALPSLAPRTMSQECTKPSMFKGWVFTLRHDQGQEKGRTEPLRTETCIQMSIIQKPPFNFTRWLLGTCQGPRRVLPGSEWSLGPFLSAFSCGGRCMAPPGNSRQSADSAKMDTHLWVGLFQAQEETTLGRKMEHNCQETWKWEKQENSSWRARTMAPYSSAS